MMQMEIVHQMESTSIHGMKMTKLLRLQNKVRAMHSQLISMTRIIVVLKRV
ncbi:Protein of unknown function [Bacillus cereus]|nr:Protein of unknown function [Bacillus cereus]